MTNEPGSQAIHKAANLSYGSNDDRDAHWAKLRKSLRAQITSNVGGRITEWWALPTDRSIEAVALGPAGLCHAVPVGKDQHRLRTVRFLPGSLWVLTSGRPVSLPTESVAEIASGGVPLPTNSLPSDFRGMLGNLPASTQLALQELFGAKADLTHDYYYELTTSPAQTLWRFLCYLTDGSILTFGSGTKVTAPRKDSTPQWDVTCYRATVTGRMR